MPYYNLYCSNERIYRWHTVEDIKQANNPILQSVIKQVKDDINSILMQIEGVIQETIKSAMEKYNPRVLGIQTIYCPSCENQQVDIIVDDQTKIRENLWRSYEADRFVREFIEVNNG